MEAVRKVSTNALCYTLNPLTAVSRGSGYKFFVTLYGEPAIRTLHAKKGRQPAARIERYMQIDTVSRRPGYTHKNRKQNIICYDIYGCTINRIYKKTSTICIFLFFGGGRGRREIIFRM